MPIKPENKARYPKNWKEIRARILERAGNKCEFCGVENHTYKLKSTPTKNGGTMQRVKVVLTIAHMEQPIENCSDENLKALCQLCHLNYDRAHHLAESAKTRREKIEAVQPSLPR